MIKSFFKKLIKEAWYEYVEEYQVSTDAYIDPNDEMKINVRPGHTWKNLNNNKKWILSTYWKEINDKEQE